MVLKKIVSTLENPMFCSTLCVYSCLTVLYCVRGQPIKSMTYITKQISKDTYSYISAGKSENILRGIGKVISLNAETDFTYYIPSARLSDKQILAKDLRRVGQDMWTVLKEG